MGFFLPSPERITGPLPVAKNVFDPCPAEMNPTGAVHIRRSPGARHLAIRVRPFQGILVTAPRGATATQISAFLAAKADWIERERRLAAAMESDRLKAERRIADIVPEEAAQQLKHRLKQLADRHGFRFSRSTVRHQRTRWGSCSATDAISLNVLLVLLPCKLVDYVLLHELLHTRIKNHSRRFWQQLDSLVGDTRKLRRSLHAYGYLLLTPPWGTP
jgi:predicted metal-dependent hydrolase